MSKAQISLEIYDFRLNFSLFSEGKPRNSIKWPVRRILAPMNLIPIISLIRVMPVSAKKILAVFSTAHFRQNWKGLIFQEKVSSKKISEPWKIEQKKILKLIQFYKIPTVFGQFILIKYKYSILPWHFGVLNRYYLIN